MSKEWCLQAHMDTQRHKHVLLSTEVIHVCYMRSQEVTFLKVL